MHLGPTASNSRESRCHADDRRRRCDVIGLSRHLLLATSGARDR
jgi:hypothetical protein